MKGLDNFLNERSVEGKYTESQMKEQISKMYDEVSLRKFGNAFRKHIDKHFSKSMNQESLRGMSWGELSSYIIGDGSYSVTQTQFRNFMEALGKKIK